MAIKKKPYFYDAQIKRVLLQIMSAFIGYQVETGSGRDGSRRRRTAPVVYGDMTRVAGYIVGSQGTQSNIIGSLPVISVYMNSLSQASSLRLDPQHVEKVMYTERLRDPDGKPIVGMEGKKKIIERFMPTFYTMGVSVSIWASNNDEVFQLLEQILQVFNPDMDILISNSPTDWTFLTNMIFNGDISMEKVVPSGGETDPLYVYTLQFSLTVPVSPPVKVYEAKPIHRIHVPIYELEEAIDGIEDFEYGPLLDGVVVDIDEDDDLVFRTTKGS